MPLTNDAKGVYPIAPTPFFDDGRIDTSSIDRLVDFYLACGCAGITVLGQLGQPPQRQSSYAVHAIPHLLDLSRYVIA